MYNTLNMLNAMRSFIYYCFVRYFYQPQNKNKTLGSIAAALQSVLGLTVVTYMGSRFRVGIVSQLDRETYVAHKNNPDLLNLMDKYLKSGDIFLDIGANMGVFSMYAAQKKGVRVFAFEPSPRELRRVYNNLLLNESYDIKAVPFGLSGKNEELKFKISADNNPGENTVYGNYTKYVDAVTCYFVRFDSFFPEKLVKNVKVCKIDVEGHEEYVLKGMSKVIGDLKNCIFVLEMTPDGPGRAGESTEAIYAFFKKNGFSYKKGYQGQGNQYEEIFYTPISLHVINDGHRTRTAEVAT